MTYKEMKQYLDKAQKHAGTQGKDIRLILADMFDDTFMDGIEGDVEAEFREDLEREFARGLIHWLKGYYSLNY